MRTANQILLGRPEEKRSHLRDLDVGGRIIKEVRMWTRFIWLRIGYSDWLL
jgi:hypothetical protein